MCNNKKYRGFDELSAFIECSTGSTPTMKTLKKYIDLLSAFGYSHLYLGLTDAYKMEGEPYFNYCRGGYTTEQLQEIDAYAQEKGIELRVNIQVLGHLHYLKRHACYADLFDTKDSLMVGKPKVYELVDKMLATMSKGVKSRVIHIGMDEIFELGLGRYLKENGYVNNRVLFLEHLNRVVELAKKYNYTCEIWSDMFFRMVQGSDFGETGVVPHDIKDSIPEGVRIVHWYYVKQTDESMTRHIRENLALSENVAFATCARKISGLAPENKYCIEMIEHQIKICRQEGIKHFMVTVWTDGAHCSNYAILPTLFATAEMARGKTLAEVDKEKFKTITGVKYDDFMFLDNLNNPFLKEDISPGARSQWGLFTDLFLGSHDMYLSPNNNEAYAVLAPMFEQINGGEYQMMFKNYYLYAKVLSVKMNLGTKIRNAYGEKNRELLEQCATVEIPKLITYMKEFIEHYEDWWLTENMAFGLEKHHLYYGGQLRRWEYEAKRLKRYLEDGEPIEELEREYLLPSVNEAITEDNCYETNPQNLISYCGL